MSNNLVRELMLCADATLRKIVENSRGLLRHLDERDRELKEVGKVADPEARRLTRLAHEHLLRTARKELRARRKDGDS